MHCQVTRGSSTSTITLKLQASSPRWLDVWKVDVQLRTSAVYTSKSLREGYPRGSNQRFNEIKFRSWNASGDPPALQTLGTFNVLSEIHVGRTGGHERGREIPMDGDGMRGCSVTRVLLVAGGTWRAEFVSLSRCRRSSLEV